MLSHSDFTVLAQIAEAAVLSEAAERDFERISRRITGGTLVEEQHARGRLFNARIAMNYWIPCWVRTPKREQSTAHSDWVLVTIEVDDVRIVWFAQYRFQDGTWWDPEGRAVSGVTAWRELPVPFDEPMPRRWPAIVRTG